MLLALVGLALLAFVLLQVVRDLSSRGRIAGVPARNGLPLLGCALDFAGNPAAFLQETRRQLGDSFVVRIMMVDMFFVFSATGLRSLYSIREADASFTEATRWLLGLKLPQELVAEGTLLKFHQGLRKKLVQTYMAHANAAVTEQLRGLGAPPARFEIFQHMKQLVHSLGLRCWVGPVSAEHMQRLVACFEQLDPEQGLKNLSSLVTIFATGKLFERRAFNDMDAVLREVWRQRQARRAAGTLPAAEAESNLDSLHALYPDCSEEQRFRNVAKDVFHFHLASQANLYAALSWGLINLLTQPAADLPRVLAEHRRLEAQYGGDDYLLDTEVLEHNHKWLECVCQESMRIAQQSITLRKVMKESVPFVTEAGTVTLPKGTYIATLLSVTNTDAGALPAQDGALPLGEFHPERYLNGELDPAAFGGDAKYHISTFGHGFHSCPGQRFALYAMKIVLVRYLSAFDITPEFSAASIPATSVGAMGRAEQPCFVACAAPARRRTGV